MEELLAKRNQIKPYYKLFKRLVKFASLYVLEPFFYKIGRNLIFYLAFDHWKDVDPWIKRVCVPSFIISYVFRLVGEGWDLEIKSLLQEHLDLERPKTTNKDVLANWTINFTIEMIVCITLDVINKTFHEEGKISYLRTYFNDAEKWFLTVLVVVLIPLFCYKFLTEAKVFRDAEEKVEEKYETLKTKQIEEGRHYQGR